MALTDQEPDRCPYPRPFPEDFADCPAYEAIRFIASDARNWPLRSWPTCRHLSTGHDVENRGRFFPDARWVPATSACSG